MENAIWHGKTFQIPLILKLKSAMKKLLQKFTPYDANIERFLSEQVQRAEKEE
jgi:hypothetical protein